MTKAKPSREERNRLDREDLARVLEHAITERQRDAFESMLTALDADRDAVLSDVQRGWVRSVRRTHEPTYENLVSAGRVPRGAEVDTPEALKNLPKRPPHRRHEVE